MMDIFTPLGMCTSLLLLLGLGVVPCRTPRERLHRFLWGIPTREGGGGRGSSRAGIAKILRDSKESTERDRELTLGPQILL